MKNIAIVLLLSMGVIAACSEGPSKEEGGEQVSPPVLNSGTATETERAIQAPKNDSADKNNKLDSVKINMPVK